MPRDFYIRQLLESPEFQRIRQRRRDERRLRFHVRGVQPRAKHSMSDADKDEVQRQLLEQLVLHRRRAFKGPVALRLFIGTSARNHTHSHNIAKNLLDLFGKSRETLCSRRQGLLYHDDYQVQALSVDCHHGVKEPSIRGMLCPMAVVLEELEIVRHLRDDDLDDDWHRGWPGDLHRAAEAINDFRRHEAEYREQLGDRGFETILQMDRQTLQTHFLDRGALHLWSLASMYSEEPSSELAKVAFQLLELHPVGLLKELPQQQAATAAWRADLDAELHALNARISPLAIPVALEVLVRPPAPSRQKGLHDLDNVVRTYVMPRVLEILQPVSKLNFTLEAPRPDQVGITRYEAWRLPPATEHEWICLQCHRAGGGLPGRRSRALGRNAG